MGLKLDWLDDYLEETAIGPVQREEALFLFALARVVRPESVLEFGAGKGHSARAFLEAGVQKVFTVDPWISAEVQQLATDCYLRLNIIQRDMRDFRMEWTGPVDMVFFDAGHSMTANLVTFRRLDPVPKFIIVHDTGEWARDHMTPIHEEFQGVVTPTGKIHQPDEVRFADWLASEGFNRLDFHSNKTLRHGLSIFQQ